MRTIDELLEMESYEGMTDDEISMLIEWRCERAAAEERESERARNNAEQVEIMRQSAAEQLEAANAYFRQMLERYN